MAVGILKKRFARTEGIRGNQTEPVKKIHHSPLYRVSVCKRGEEKEKEKEEDEFVLKGFLFFSGAQNGRFCCIVLQGTHPTWNTFLKLFQKKRGHWALVAIVGG